MRQSGRGQRRVNPSDDEFRETLTDIGKLASE